MGRFSQMLKQKNIDSDVRPTQNQYAADPVDWYWEVIGGENTGGIVVRESEEVTSDRSEERLACGAIVREVQLVGNRLEYAKISGDGPNKGWVSISSENKELLTKVEIYSSQGDADNDRVGGPPPAFKVELPVPAPGTGALYQVVAEQVAVRSAPNLKAKVTHGYRQGQAVEMYEWDETQNWRLVVDRCQQPGWMMLDHPQLGALLRPHDRPFQRDPLNPVGVAVREGNMEHLKAFISRGLDIHRPDADGHTPLMQALASDRPEAVLLLMQAKAQIDAQGNHGVTAVDIAATASTRHMLLALALRDFNPNLCQEAVCRIRPELQQLAQEKLAIPMRLQLERLAANK